MRGVGSRPSLASSAAAAARPRTRRGGREGGGPDSRQAKQVTACMHHTLYLGRQSRARRGHASPPAARLRARGVLPPPRRRSPSIAADAAAPAAKPPTSSPSSVPAADHPALPRRHCAARHVSTRRSHGWRRRSSPPHGTPPTQAMPKTLPDSRRGSRALAGARLGRGPARMGRTAPARPLGPAHSPPGSGAPRKWTGTRSWLLRAAADRAPPAPAPSPPALAGG